ncbi:citrate (Si)-synthase [Simkania negevensis]|uniref:citrate synthase (unknown stereospecificity) n=1 Tax=Simkania negevensis TaxID=83561 RepID=A0ABS3AR03_9BACT|nr:citrate (Si)-synthase [Simkania negevensis]
MTKQDALFEITKDHLETGLRGYPVGHCPTSYVDAQKGLFYAGIAIDELIGWVPQEVIYLLYQGKKGSKEEVEVFHANLKKRAGCSDELKKSICSLPRQGHPMKLFCAALLLCGMVEGKGDYREDCLNLIAKIPEVAAIVINHHAGWGGTNPSLPDLGYIPNFVHMLNAPDIDRKTLMPVFQLFNILHYDHGGGNLSTFIGKAVASGLEDMYGSMASAMCALAGPRHGKANQDCLEFVKEVASTLGEGATEEEMEDLLRHRLANKQLVYGFGHAVLRVEDPRATVQYDYAKHHFPNHPLVRIALLLRNAGTKVLKENPKVTNPYPNVDAISGTLLTAAGFPHPEYYTVLFGTSRVVGIAIQTVYERCEARGGKGTPIVRPKYFYRPREEISS